MTTIPGDPSSTSALGGSLRGHSLRLVSTVEQLAEASRRAVRGGSADPTALERELLLAAAEELDRLGGLLQTRATDVVEGAARARQIAAEGECHDLHVSGHLVLEASGPSRVDPTLRLETRQRLQSRLNRLTAQDARARARLQRELQTSAKVLARTSERARLAPF